MCVCVCEWLNYDVSDSPSPEVRNEKSDTILRLCNVAVNWSSLNPPFVVRAPPNVGVHAPPPLRGPRPPPFFPATLAVFKCQLYSWAP